MNPEITPQNPEPHNPRPQNHIPPNPVQPPPTPFNPPPPQHTPPQYYYPPQDESGIPTPAEQKKQRKAEKKRQKALHKERWKAKKREHREQLKLYYQDAPWLVRVSRLYLLKPLLIVTAIVMLLGFLASIVAATLYLGLDLIVDELNELKNQPVEAEKIYALSPLDEEGAAAIRALPAGDPSETWAIYVYLVGADLEDNDMSVLSDLTQVQAASVQEEILDRKRTMYKNLLNGYEKNLEQHDLTMPEFLYYPNPEAISVYESYEEYGYIDEDRIGFGTIDISEMTEEPLADNITIVVQTGGSRKWSQPQVNPNKLQRFCIQGGSFREEQSLPLQPSSDPETLADFIRYCREEHPADHSMLILWDHGAGVFGYGCDEIFGDMMSIAGVREALAAACEPDMQNPPFDIIGYDACLMGNLDVMHTLEGFADYYLMSEESEPADGWDYTSFLRQLSENPGMHPAALCQAVADTYTDHYMTQNVNLELFGLVQDTTFSVIDARKGAELYQAYSALTKRQLTDAAKDISVLAEMGRAGTHATHYAADMYNYYNTIDLGNYVDYLVDSYPEECSRIRNLLEETVLYHRENGSLSDSQGVTIYLPASIETYAGTIRCLEYIDRICEDPSTQALYYYKISGCLTPEMKRYVRTLTDTVPQTLNTKPFSGFTKAVPEIDGETFSVPMDATLQKMIQSYGLQVAQYLEDKEVVVYYGEDEYAYLDGEGHITSGEFDGNWIYLENVPLAAELVSSSVSSVEYRAKILKDGFPAYLMFTYDRDSEEFTINGTKPIEDEQDGDAWMINNKTDVTSPVGCKITPLYTEQDLYTGDKSDRKGKTVKFKENSEILMKPLPDGDYLSLIEIEDQRGDTYSSGIVDVTISGGRIKALQIDPDFVAKEW